MTYPHHKIYYHHAGIYTLWCIIMVLYKTFHIVYRKCKGRIGKMRYNQVRNIQNGYLRQFEFLRILSDNWSLWRQWRIPMKINFFR